jgi:apolipoprotein D and lipocalin family protein
MKRKIAVAGLLMLLASALVKAEKKEKAPLRVVPSVDLTRYEGLWYEIARLPNRFQNDCAGDVTANYTLLNENRIEVINRCRRKDGTFTKAKGVARLADDEGPNSRLKVRFAPSFLSFLPFVWGDYQIIELASDYSYALVGEPGRKYLWILSRNPEMDANTFAALKAVAVSQGFDVGPLIRTEHKDEGARS